MKNLQFTLLLFGFLAAFSLNAQSGVNRDTLNSGETVYFYAFDKSDDTAAVTMKGGNLYITLRSDSLSGATNVVNEIQYAVEGDNDLYDWVTQSSGTLTSNGATSQTLIFEDTFFGARKWRIKSVATGTQATKITTSWARTD